MSKLVTHNLPGCRLVAATDGHWHRARRTKPPTPTVPCAAGLAFGKYRFGSSVLK